jgi:3-deoxy-D-manno-octulosonic-acid transferase
VLLTHMTATGRAAGAAFAPGVAQAWLPYDVPRYVRAFLRHFRPAAGILLETEVWPNLIACANGMHVPLYLVNARLSERSARRYRRIRSLASGSFRALSGIAAQTDTDAARIGALSGTMPAVTGSLKFDVTIDPALVALGEGLRAGFGQARAVWLAASTREGEEALLLDAWQRTRDPALLVLVPRHPQRFDAVARLLAERNVKFVRRSDKRPPPPDVAVVLGDSMGEMTAYCAAADVVLMGGSLLPFGGQNLIEPLALGKPTVVGPHMFNFAQVTADATRAGAVIAAPDAARSVEAVVSLLHDPARREAMASAARAFHAAHAGALERLWSWLAPKLDAALAAPHAAAGDVTPRAGD